MPNEMPSSDDILSVDEAQTQVTDPSASAVAPKRKMKLRLPPFKVPGMKSPRVLMGVAAAAIVLGTMGGLAYKVKSLSAKVARLQKGAGDVQKLREEVQRIDRESAARLQAAQQAPGMDPGMMKALAEQLVAMDRRIQAMEEGAKQAAAAPAPAAPAAKASARKPASAAKTAKKATKGKRAKR